MWKRRIILIALLGAFAFGGVRLWAWRKGLEERQLALHLTQLNSNDPVLRLASAEALLRRDGTQHEYRLIRAKALIELGRHHEAREQLQVLYENDSASAERFIGLQIASYFAESDILLSGADRERSADVLERITAFMTGVQKQSLLLVELQRAKPFDTMLNEARRHDVMSRARRLVLDAKRVELTKAKIGGVLQIAETLGLEVGAIEKQIEADDQKLANLCTNLMQSDPKHPLPLELMFRYHLRRGEFAQARGVAAIMAAWPKVPADAVGRIADALLELETHYAVEPTKEDLDVVESLLTHPDQTGEQTLQYRLAWAEFMLQTGNPVEADEIAHEVLAREWLNARARCIVARAYVAQGDAASGITELQKFTELSGDARVRYTLGLCYLAGGQPLQINLGQEALRQCLDIEPNHLPARLRLIESFSSTGFLIEAADDIQVVEQINPRHPRVTALRASIAVESEDLGLIATLIDQQLKSNATVLRHDDVALVVAMVLDDGARVRRIATEIATSRPEDIFVLLAERWMKKDPVRRARLSPVIVRSLHAFLDQDPLASPGRPRLPRAGVLSLANASAAGATVDKFEPLTTIHFVPRPLDVALEAVEIALDQWPAMPSLLSAAAEINLWLGRATAARQWVSRMPPDFQHVTGEIKPHSIDSLMSAYLEGRFDDLRAALTEAAAGNNGQTPTHRWFDLDLALRSQDPKLITESLRRILTAHPWAELPLLMTIADALRRDQPDRAYALLGVAQEINPQVAQLSRGRLNLALGRAADALQDMEKLLSDEKVETDVRRWAAEVRARANLLLDQAPHAVGVFDQLAASLHEHRLDASIAAVDVLITFGKPTGAAEMLSEMLSVSESPARMTDRMLARAETVMKPSRMRAMVDTLLTYRVNDPVLLLYQAGAIAHDDDVVAERVIRNVLSRHTKSPRAMMLLAEVLSTVQPDETRKIYLELTQRGGRVAEVAQRRLDGLNARQSPLPVTVKREGSPE